MIDCLFSIDCQSISVFATPCQKREITEYQKYKNTGKSRLANLVSILREKKESRPTRLAQGFDTGFDKKSFSLICVTKEKRKIS